MFDVTAPFLRPALMVDVCGDISTPSKGEMAHLYTSALCLQPFKQEEAFKRPFKPRVLTMIILRKTL